MRETLECKFLHDNKPQTHLGSWGIFQLPRLTTPVTLNLQSVPRKFTI